MGTTNWIAMKKNGISKIFTILSQQIINVKLLLVQISTHYQNYFFLINNN